MELTFTTRLKQAWNAFLNNKDPTTPEYRDIGASYSVRPDRPRLTPGNERSIITSIVNRIAMDAAAVKIRHVRLNEDEQYVADMDSSLNNVLSLEANIDQASRAALPPGLYQAGCSCRCARYRISSSPCHERQSSV